MEKIFLLKKDKIMLGPYSKDQIREKGLKASDLVWYEGLADWTPAGNLPELQLGTLKVETVAEAKRKVPLLNSIKKFFSLK